MTFEPLGDNYAFYNGDRGEGPPLQLARAVKNVLDVTATPFPQKPPAHPTTPLNPTGWRR